MADGTSKAIADIELGDMVLAEDPETGKRGPHQVTHLWIHQDQITDLELADGSRVSTTTAYNLAVDDIHTYFVRIGTEDVLVHNTTTCTVTRLGVSRNNPAEWRRTRGLWDRTLESRRLNHGKTTEV